MALAVMHEQLLLHVEGDEPMWPPTAGAVLAEVVLAVHVAELLLRGVEPDVAEFAAGVRQRRRAQRTQLGSAVALKMVPVQVARAVKQLLPEEHLPAVEARGAEGPPVRLQEVAAEALERREAAVPVRAAIEP